MVNECSVPICFRPAKCRGLCHVHYDRLRRLGDVQADKPIRDRSGVWGKVEKVPGGCWLFHGAITGGGYGQVTVNRRIYPAHRVVYEELVGLIPAGLDLDHLCRVRNCVNPDHLEPVTRRENLVRGVGVIARQARQAHCIHGHPFSGPNLGIDKRGRRYCRTCLRERQRARRRRFVVTGFDVK